MTLNGFIETPKNPVSLKSALRRMRRIWDKGPVDRFDTKLARVLVSSVEEASEIREKWVVMGFLCYDRKGLLAWRNGGF